MVSLIIDNKLSPISAKRTIFVVADSPKQIYNLWQTHTKVFWRVGMPLGHTYVFLNYHISV